MNALEPVEPGDSFPFPEIRSESIPLPGIVAVGPNLGHALLLLVLTIVFIVVAQFGALLLVRQLHPLGHHTLRGYAEMLQGNPLWLIPTEAAGYALVVLAAIPIFRAIWHRPFAQGLHWNLRTALRFFWQLALLGLLCGFGIGLLGNFLPMPKDPPIMADLMRSPLGAWLMLLFGITGAPLFEEMAFRGFLLPGFLNLFRWLSLKGSLPPRAVVWVGVPVSVVLTSAPFALLHAAQVSHAWAPVLLIGIVSLVLCIVRLRLNSLACSTVVHSAYNFTLFAGILIQTGGFRHMNHLGP